MSKRISRIWIPIFSAVVSLAFIVVLVIPVSRRGFADVSNAHPYIMGFLKFALLATVGELLHQPARKELGRARQGARPPADLGPDRRVDYLYDEDLPQRRLCVDGVRSVAGRGFHFPACAVYEHDDEPDLRPHVYGGAQVHG